MGQPLPTAPGTGPTPTAVAVSPAGGRVFVTGIASGWGTGPDYVTVAYSAANGRQLWVSHYSGHGVGLGNDWDGASAVAVSPGGAAVFVTGMSGRGTGESDYATVAYSAASSRRLWVSRSHGPASGLDGANAVAVSPAGGTVFVPPGPATAGRPASTRRWPTARPPAGSCGAAATTAPGSLSTAPPRWRLAGTGPGCS